MTKQSRFGSRELPLVLCVGTSADDLAAVLAATSGRVAVLYVPDAAGLREVLAEQPSEPRMVEHGKLRLDADLREATWCGSPIPLSARDFDLLFSFARDPGRVWAFRELTERVWGRTYIGDTEAVVSAVKRLRRQLRAAGTGVHVVSVRGVGYRLVVDEPATDPASA